MNFKQSKIDNRVQKRQRDFSSTCILAGLAIHTAWHALHDNAMKHVNHKFDKTSAEIKCLRHQQLSQYVTISMLAWIVAEPRDCMCKIVNGIAVKEQACYMEKENYKVAIATTGAHNLWSHAKSIGRILTWNAWHKQFHQTQDNRVRNVIERSERTLD